LEAIASVLWYNYDMLNAIAHNANPCCAALASIGYTYLLLSIR